MNIICFAGDPKMKQLGSATVIRHREFLSTIAVPATQVHVTQTYPLTPQSTLFEWCRQMGELFTFYRWRKLAFHFKSRVVPIQVNALGATAPSKGTMCAMIDYDARNYVRYLESIPPVPQKNAVLDSSGAREVGVDQSFVMRVDCSAAATNNANLLTIIDGIIANENLTDREVNYGTLFCRYDGPALSSVATPIYDVWVDYELELYKPKSSELFDASSNADLYSLRFGANPTLEDDHVLGNSTETVSDLHYSLVPTSLGKKTAGAGINSIIGLEDANATPGRNRIAFTPRPDHVYLISYSVRGSALDAAALMVANLGPGFVDYDGFHNGTASVQSTGDDTSFQCQIKVQSVADKVSNQFTLSGAVHTMTAGDYWVDLELTSTLYVAASATTSGNLIITDLGREQSMP